MELLGLDIAAEPAILFTNPKHGVRVKAYTVYRFDSRTNVTEPVGRVVERRKGERNDNAADMLRLAQKLYGPPLPGSHLFLRAANSYPTF